MNIPRTGFSVLEMTVTSGLMALLAVATSNAVVGLGKASIGQRTRCEFQQQLDVALAFLTRDLSGHLHRVREGSKGAGAEVGRQVDDQSELRLCFDGDNANGVADWGSPDAVVVYYRRGETLMRYDEEHKLASTVAKHVADFRVTAQGSDTRIEITFQYRGQEKSLTLVARQPY